ncbi:lateral organ boundaries-domain 29 [Actinidia rufa]|uniref:Lateral organ boundaries-domain 29 n=1 Tax=Actinidia rufa TaxID=165716 RepID=A0A7J0GRV3_9ERIC|nr:lateral organ boundaries-domain 29 [Actinidia rufa]
MTGSGSPCGACKFLRRKCVKGCVFAPYFCHDEGASHFAAIHKVFGASNVSKLLAHLPVVNLQAQLASLKEQAARTFSANPSERFNGKFPNPPQDVQSWFPCENSSRMPQLDQNILFGNFGNNPYFENGLMNPNSFPIKPEENASFSGFEEASQSMDSIDLQTNGQWPFQDDANELPSMAFGYIQH